MTPATVGDALAAAKAAGTDRLDAQLLLGHVLGRSRTWLLANDDAPLDARAADRFADALARRRAGEPVAYLVGEKEFHGLTLKVDRRVLVPRPDTEVLVDWALELIGPGPCRVVDLGTGSGAIALAVKASRPAANVVATDASAAALDVARANAERLGLAVEFALGSWWSAVAGRRFELMLSNPPYIAGGDPHLEPLRHEPIEALTPGGDGLGDLRRLAEGARGHAAPGAWLLLEHGFDQAVQVCALLRAAGATDVATREDLAGRPRCTGGRF